MKDYLIFLAKVNLEQNTRLLSRTDLLRQDQCTQAFPDLYGGSILGALKCMVENARFSQSNMCPLPSAEFRVHGSPYLAPDGSENLKEPLETYDEVRTALLTLSRSFVDGLQACREQELLSGQVPAYDFLSKGLFLAMSIRGQIIYLLSQQGITDLETQFAGALLP